MSCFPCCDNEINDDVDTEMVHIKHEDHKYDYTSPREIKITVLGNGGVGKSALTIRLITGNFAQEYDPTIEDSYRKQVIIDERPVLLDILDTAGQEEFSSMQDQWIREAHAFLLVYSITNKDTFGYIDMIIDKVYRLTESEHVPIVVVGNKCDLEDERQIHRDELNSYCKMLNVPCYETSAKQQINVHECFYQCYREWRNIKEDGGKKKKKKRKKKKKKKDKKLEKHIENVPTKMVMKNEKRELKITVLGVGAVGKSSLTIRFTVGTWQEEYDPTIESSYSRQVSIDGNTMLFDILDTAGQEQFAALQHHWIREGDAFLLVYSINSKKTFDYIDIIRKQICRNREEDAYVPMVIVGNKCDLEDERQVHRDELNSYSKMLNVPCFESSAKENINVDECFYECFREWRKFKEGKYDNDDGKKKKKKSKRRKKKDKKLEKHIELAMDDNDEEKQKHNDELSMNINIAVIGGRNVGKHSMIHHFIGELVNFNDNDKKDVYYTTIETNESEKGENDVLGCFEQLELEMKVHCIENSIADKQLTLSPSTFNGRPNHLNIVPSGSFNDELNRLSGDLGRDYDNKKEWDIEDIVQNNDGLLFVAEIVDKQSLSRCVECIKNIKNDKDNYSYRKPIIIVVTKCDLPNNLHELTECDIAELANSIGVPFMMASLDNFKDKEAFNRLISCIRGYSTPWSFVKIRNLYQHDRAAWSLAQSLNGKYLYSTGNDGTIRIWDINTSICIGIILCHKGKVHQVEEYNVLSCTYLISCADDGLCCVWNNFCNDVDVEKVKNNDNIPLFINCPRFAFKHEERIRSFCVCDDNILCTISDDKKMKLWSLIDGSLLYNCDNIQLGVLNQAVYVLEYDKLFVSSTEQCIYVWNLKETLNGNKGCIKLEGGHHNNINELRICKKSDNEIYLISMDESGYIRCWDAGTPTKRFADFQKHNDSINYVSICKLNKDVTVFKSSIKYDYILCTASRDKTIRGYSIPEGEIVYNIADSNDTLRAIDCDWNANFIVAAGKDNYIRCYKLLSNNINYQFRQYDIDNNLQISLKWAYQRHEGYLNRILCGKQQFKHMVFSSDRDGIILGWDMNIGKCIKCYGSNDSTATRINDAKKEVRMEFITMIIQFIQLSTFAFSININWGEFNDTYNPFSLCANLFQFDISKYSNSISWIDWFYNNISIPIEWIISILCITIFMILFCISYKFKYMGDKGEKFKRILSFFCWITMGVGFVPILRNIFKIFVCHNINNYLINGENDCWISISHWIYIAISIIALILYLPTAYRIESRSGDLEQINSYYWLKWSKDYPQQRRVHFASPRTNSLAAIDKSIVIIMIAVSVFLVSGENVNQDVELGNFEEKQLLIMDYIIIAILLAASAILCIAILIKPPFYFRKMNIFNAALFFGVLWTDLWCLFVISEDEVRQWSRLRRQRIDQIKTIGHLAILFPFMCFGAFLMWIRTHRNWYDEIRGGFRKSFYDKGVGIIAENNDNNHNSTVNDNNLLLTKNVNTMFENEEQKEEELPQYHAYDNISGSHSIDDEQP